MIPFALNVSLLAGAIAMPTTAQAPPADSPFDGVRLLDAASCANCHKVEYKMWAGSTHSTFRMQCTECHGELHSAALGGCKRCHQAIHKKRFDHWPEVTRFDEEGGTDHMCMVCHDPHHGKLKPHLKDGCFRCHGDTHHTILVDAVHRRIASLSAPIAMDIYAREKAMARATFGLPESIAKPLTQFAGYAVCFLVLLPLGHAVTVVVVRRSKRPKAPDSDA